MESKSFLLLTAPHQRIGWGCTRTWEGSQMGQLIPIIQRDIHLVSHDAMFSIKSWGKKKEGRDIWSDAICPPRWPLHRAPIPGDDWTIGRSQWILCFALLAYVWVLLYLSNFLYFNLQVFSLLPFPFSPPCQKERVSGCVVLSWQLGLNHESHQVQIGQMWEFFDEGKRKKRWSNSSHHSHHCFFMLLH